MSLFPIFSPPAGFTEARGVNFSAEPSPSGDPSFRGKRGLDSPKRRLQKQVRPLRDPPFLRCHGFLQPSAPRGEGSPGPIQWSRPGAAPTGQRGPCDARADTAVAVAGGAAAAGRPDSRASPP